MSLLIAEFLEGLMLVCFGLAWPLSILKMLRTHSAKSKSIPFVAVVALGYMAGIAHKTIRGFESGDFSPVLFLYILNGAMIAVDLVLSVKYRKQ